MWDVLEGPGARDRRDIWTPSAAPRSLSVRGALHCPAGKTAVRHTTPVLLEAWAGPREGVAAVSYAAGGLVRVGVGNYARQSPGRRRRPDEGPPPLRVQGWGAYADRQLVTGGGLVSPPTPRGQGWGWGREQEVP